MEAAYAEFEESVKGSVEPGKLADMTVISADVTKLSAKEILSVQVLKTFVGGRIVYQTTQGSGK